MIEDTYQRGKIRHDYIREREFKNHNHDSLVNHLKFFAIIIWVTSWETKLKLGLLTIVSSF